MALLTQSPDPIHPAFADKIAARYIAIYNNDGFVHAQKYLDGMVKGDPELREHLVPIIIQRGREGR